MSDWNNASSEFEFVESSSVDTDEFGMQAEEFAESVEEGLVDKSAVIIFTDHYCIHGKISLVPGARLTDYIIEANAFIAVTEVEVKDKAGNLILTTPFMDINRDRIELIMPAEFVKLS